MSLRSISKIQSPMPEQEELVDERAQQADRNRQEIERYKEQLQDQLQKELARLKRDLHEKIAAARPGSSAPGTRSGLLLPRADSPEPGPAPPALVPTHSNSLIPRPDEIEFPPKDEDTPMHVRAREAVICALGSSACCEMPCWWPLVRARASQCQLHQRYQVLPCRIFRPGRAGVRLASRQPSQ